MLIPNMFPVTTVETVCSKMRETMGEHWCLWRTYLVGRFWDSLSRVGKMGSSLCMGNFNVLEVYEKREGPFLKDIIVTHVTRST